MFSFGYYNILLLGTFLSFLYGQAWMWLGFTFLVAASVIGDRLLPHDTSRIEGNPSRILNFLLYSIFPLLLVNVFAFIWQMTPGDWLGIGQWASDLFGIDALAHKEARSTVHTIGAILSMGLLSASGGTNVAHELVHRTWDPKAVYLGRFLLSFTFDTSFSIEHVYGHHANIATRKDPASARRGESLLPFAIRSTYGAIKGAWAIECERLRKRKLRVWGYHNRFLQGQLISVALLALYASAGGWQAIVLCLGVGIYGKAYLEMVNYIEHYGLVRVPGSPVAPRHSWNSNHYMSSILLYNLTRHSHHHEKGHLPFWKLEPMAHSPMLPYGYMSMILLALVPPVYKRVMNPRLSEWDLNFASEAEKSLLKNEETGKGNHFQSAV